MPHLIELNTFASGAGNLTVFEKIIPGTIKRVFYIYGASESPRGGHRHHKTWNALVCIHGSCRVYSNDGTNEEYFSLIILRRALFLNRRTGILWIRFPMMQSF